MIEALGLSDTDSNASEEVEHSDLLLDRSPLREGGFSDNERDDDANDVKSDGSNDSDNDSVRRLTTKQPNTPLYKESSEEEAEDDLIINDTVDEGRKGLSPLSMAEMEIYFGGGSSLTTAEEQQVRLKKDTFSKGFAGMKRLLTEPELERYCEEANLMRRGLRE